MHSSKTHEIGRRSRALHTGSMSRWWLLSVLALGACAGSAAQQKPVQTAPKPAAVPAPPPPPPAQASAPGSAPPDPGAGPNGDGVLPETLEAGAIARGTLSTVLASGIGRFLQRLHAQPELDDKGRFAGWRIVSFAEGDASLRSSVLRPGDTVVHVNGRPIERPEQFKDVWDSLGSSTELVLQIRRAGKTTELHY